MPKSTQSFLLDNNVFVAAIAHPTRMTGTLRLIIHLIAEDGAALIGDNYLAEEMLRYTEVYPSDTAASLIEAIALKIKLINVEERYLKICRKYIETTDLSDVVHAAACLQTHSTLISDDHHFDKINAEKIINVWSTNTAIKELLGI